jgi:hypothetical protein
MEMQISHSRSQESPEAKARWFQSLTVEERAEMLESFVEMILEANPKILESKVAKPVEGRIRVVSTP